MKHTQGPLKVFAVTLQNSNLGDVSVRLVSLDNSPGEPICTMNLKRKEMIHDAKLFAAAPDMLEALEKLFKVHEETGLLLYYFEDSHVVEIENLIKKAKGEL